MRLGRLLQILGLLIVGGVLVYSLNVADMTVEFGGLIVGALVFAAGRALDRREGDGSIQP